MTKIAERLEAHPAWTESTLITALFLSVTVTVCVYLIYQSLAVLATYN